MGELSKKFEDLTQELVTAQQKNKALSKAKTDEASMLTTRCETTAASLTAAETRVSALTKQLSERDDDLEKAKQLHATAEAQLKSTKTELSSAVEAHEQDRSKLSQELVAFAKALAGEKEAKAAVEEELTQTTGALATTKASLAAEGQKAASLQEGVDKLAKQVEELSSERSRLETSVKEGEHTRSAAEAKHGSALAALTTTLEAAQKSSAKHESKVKELKGQVAEVGLPQCSVMRVLTDVTSSCARR